MSRNKGRGRKSQPPSAAEVRKNERERQQHERERQRTAAARNKEYERKLRQAKEYGLYEPKAPELTSYRKWRINKAIRENSRFFDPKEYTFLRAPKSARHQAGRQGYKETFKGFFVPKHGFERVTISKAKGKSRRGEYDIKLHRRIREGKGKGKIEHKLIPLAPIDRIMQEADTKYKGLAKGFGPLAKNERYGYIIKAYEDINGRGYSYMLFNDYDLMMKFFKERYSTRDDFATMLATLEIRKTTWPEWKAEAEPFRSKRRKRGMRRRGNR